MLRKIHGALVFLLLGVGLSAGACGGTVIETVGSGTGGGGSGGTGGGSTGDGGTAGSGGTGGSSGCPAQPPAEGSPCSPDGKMCVYTEGCGGVDAQCSNGAWIDIPLDPPCGCPPQEPVAGSACNPCCKDICSYADGSVCGPTAECSPSGTWSISVPPCPPMQCSSFTNPNDCLSAGSCRWLVPGCVMPPPFTAGCFDAQDCIPGMVCPSGQSCVTVNTNPCWDSNCETCAGGMADICFGPG